MDDSFNVVPVGGGGARVCYVTPDLRYDWENNKWGGKERRTKTRYCTPFELLAEDESTTAGQY